MRRPIGWVDKDYPEGRREIRVKFHADTIKWQFRLKGTKEWDSTSVPSEDDWLELEDKILRLMQRGHLYQRELELTRRRGKSKDKGS
ncbi:MAG: hypothetical protein GX927_06645 [Lentisphaerae bacterium]|jgi:hypothetical protein|nr:hypothetical protein [Lentisphaerota bacterium]